MTQLSKIPVLNAAVQRIFREAELPPPGLCANEAAPPPALGSVPPLHLAAPPPGVAPDVVVELEAASTGPVAAVLPSPNGPVDLST